MKYCYHCGHITAGEPLFCNSCGRSYDLKFCPRLHPNPRIAEVCSRCGSRVLSTPQPKVSAWWRVLGFSLQIILGACLVFLSITLFVQLISKPHVQDAIVVGAPLGLLWWVWSEFPDWLKKIARRLIKGKEPGNGD
jgi:hypothetical protein